MLAHRLGQQVERLRVDEEAARVFEQPRLQVELPQRAAALVLRAEAGEVLRETGGAPDLGFERRLLGEEQVFQEALGHALEVADVLVAGERHLGLVVQPREEVVHVRLVLQHHERDDVAVRRGEAVEIHELLERGEVAEVVGLFLRFREGGFAEEIAAMRHLAVRARDIPAAPAVFERRAVVHLGNTRDEVNDALLVSFERADEMAGHAHCLRGRMAFETLVVADELRLVAGGLLQRVEDAAKLRVHLADFHDRRVGNPADVNVVVEKNRTRRLRRNALALKRGFREEQRLRLGRNLQRRQQRVAPAARSGVELELHLAPVDAVLQAHDGAGGRRLVVADGVFLKGHHVRRTLKIRLCGGG